MKTYKWYSPNGEALKTKSIKEFSAISGISLSHSRDLACAWHKSYNGWCSGNKKAAKTRARFLTVLVHPTTGKREIIGQTITGFAERHGLCANELYKLFNGKKIIYRGWMLERTHQLARGEMPAINL